MIFFRAAYAKHPFEVLLYATKHGYPQLMNVAERESVKLSPTKAYKIFSPAVYIAWVNFSSALAMQNN